jgi:uncharacterized protein YoxC
MLKLIWNFVLDNLEVINFLLAVIGFVFLGIEVAKTKNAAQAARDASNRTIKRVSTRTTVSDIYGIAEILRSISGNLRTANYYPALFRCDEIRHNLSKLKMRDHFNSPQRKQELQTIIAGVRKLQDRLERINSSGDDREFDLPNTNSQLTDYSNKLIELAEEIRFHKQES